ncbi:hypothetical protein CPT_Mater89 [Bacillus phage Mater]|uniref:Uncharacterized protein n=1 Tax=Bacillus phage Mater TaxID=1540090 RepID=A0A0A0RRY7_9CAUD|nr:hypothetical protein CPT_Mater89 [Bacillus phage Mater]AIW03246.1 hypothetical protein CPT_Mater89 [Bacillus phage Mater]
MEIKAVKRQYASLQKVKNLMNDESKKVQGVFYSNSFFSRNYLARAHTIVDDLDVAADTITLTVSARMEDVGLLELENTLDALVRYDAGDVPGFMPESLLEGSNIEEQKLVPEFVSATRQLYSVDLYLILDAPRVTYQEFTIAGKSFTLVNLHKMYDGNEFEQIVTLLFGDKDAFYFFSNFSDKDLSLRDSKIILDLIVDENITGKVIKGVKLETSSGSGIMFPYERMINSYTNLDGDIIFGVPAGSVRIPKEEINSYRMQVIPQGARGNYQIVLTNSKNTIRIFME